MLGERLVPSSSGRGIELTKRQNVRLISMDGLNRPSFQPPLITITVISKTFYFNLISSMFTNMVKKYLIRPNAYQTRLKRGHTLSYFITLYLESRSRISRLKMILTRDHGWLSWHRPIWSACCSCSFPIELDINYFSEITFLKCLAWSR